MTLPLDILEAQVLSLPVADRSALLDKLLLSLSHGSDWEQAWAEEADRREARIANAQSGWIDGPDAVARIRAALR